MCNVLPCPKCGRVATPADAKRGWIHCAACRTQFRPQALSDEEMPESCRRCGATVRPEAKHCHWCGIAAPAAKPMDRMLWPLTCALLVAVLVWAALAFVLLWRSDQQAIAGATERIARLEAERDQLALAGKRAALAEREKLRLLERVGQLQKDVLSSASEVWKAQDNLPPIAKPKVMLEYGKSPPARSASAADPIMPARPSEVTAIPGDPRQRENWASLSDALSQKRPISKERARQLLGPPETVRDYTSSVIWVYRVNSGSGYVTVKNDQVTWVTPPEGYFFR